MNDSAVGIGGSTGLNGAKSSYVDADITLPFSQRFAFAIGDLGYNSLYYWVSAYLMFFYTDIFLIPAAAVSTLLLVVRIFDAVNDPFIGSLADKTKAKTGSYKLWIWWGSFAMGVGCILLFWAHPEWPYGVKIVYMYATYLIVTAASTASNMAYGSLSATMTTNILERTKMQSLRMMMVQIANMIVVAFAPALLLFLSNEGTNMSQGYLLALILFAVLCVPMLGITAFRCKEVVQYSTHETKVPLRLRLSALFKAKPIILVILGMISYGFVYYGRAAVYPYYFTYFLNNPTLQVWFGIVLGIGGVVGNLIAPKLHMLMKHKGHASGFVLFVCAAAMAIMFWVSYNVSPLIFYFLVFINGICQGAHMGLMFSIIPDSVDYSIYKYNVNCIGFLYACTSFAFKLGNAIGTALTAAVLAWLGYVANQAQTSGVLSGINVMMTLAAAVMSIIAGLFFWVNPLSDEKYAEMSQALAKRRAES